MCKNNHKTMISKTETMKNNTLGFYTGTAEISVKKNVLPSYWGYLWQQAGLWPACSMHWKNQCLRIGFSVWLIMIFIIHGSVLPDNPVKCVWGRGLLHPVFQYQAGPHNYIIFCKTVGCNPVLPSPDNFSPFCRNVWRCYDICNDGWKVALPQPGGKKMDETFWWTKI